MLNSRKLALRKETLTELTGSELKGVAGAARSLLPCLIDVPQSIATCVDTITIATCTCPPVTGGTCVCPTDAVC
jgi:hypothetical protein